jgi:hypothetical protein
MCQLSWQVCSQTGHLCLQGTYSLQNKRVIVVGSHEEAQDTGLRQGVVTAVGTVRCYTVLI